MIETGDISFDMMQAGHKVRCLVMPFGIDTRGLSGRNENMKMTQVEIDKLMADASAEFARLKAQLVIGERRVAALERERRGETQDDLPQFYVPINRAVGTVDSLPPLDPSPLRKQRRELSPETGIPYADLPEYYVPVNRSKGTVGDDR